MQYSLPQTLKSVFCLLLACQAVLCHAQEWKLEKQQQQITVSSKKSDSGYKNILATTIVKSRPEALLHLFDDVERGPLWIANCIKVEVISAPSENERIVHSYFSAPWPIKDRDMVTYSLSSVQQDSLSIVISNSGDTYPTNEAYVRMQNMFGEWKVNELANGEIQISYQGGGNPAGKLPRWVANKALIGATFETFINLTNIIVDDRYQQAQITP
jgi:hypothetical protein